MRDYNTIPFRRPRAQQQQQQQQLQEQQQQQQQLKHSSSNEGTRKVDQLSTSTVGTSSLSPTSSPQPPQHQQQQQQQQQQATPNTNGNRNSERTNNASNNNNSSSNNNNSSSSNNNNNTTRSSSPRPSGLPAPSSSRSPSLSAADALAVRRDGPEATIARLRQTLEDSAHREASDKAHLAKSDAAIVELKSSVRTLKRQLEKQANNNNASSPNNSNNTPATVNTHAAGDSSDARVGELQVQLDRAHAQILTADMFRKELEDTLEAEQYTWELRTQDQERQIAGLQQECATVNADLEQGREHWRETEAQYQQQVQVLQRRLEQAEAEKGASKNNNHADNSNTDNARGLDLGNNENNEANWIARVRHLEEERAELQGCLDEALKELEAVDAELQTDDATADLKLENKRLTQMLRERDGTLLEPLQHLYRCLLERTPQNGEQQQQKYNHHTPPQTEQELLAAIQSHLDREPPVDRSVAEIRHEVQQLESQISVYKGDLQAREERNAELRASLKEAVGLLKPLQDAASKADREKQKLRNEIDELQRHGSQASRDEIKSFKRRLENKEDEIEELKQEVATLEIQLSKAKLAAASNLVPRGAAAAAPSATSDSVSKIRAKRAAEQETLQSLLKDTKSRFSALNQQPQSRGLQTAQDQLAVIGDSATASDVGFGVQTAEDALRGEMDSLKSELARKEAELRIVQNDLDQAQAFADNDDVSRLEEAQSRVDDLQSKVDTLQDDLKVKRKTERDLSRSLKEALNLLQPLQRHLEAAEREKKQLSRELDSLKRQLQHQQQTPSPAAPGSVSAKRLQALQLTVEQLEKENSQLHDALEDMSFNASQLSGISTPSKARSLNGSGNNNNSTEPSRLREEIVELKSRYEVTQGRLQDSFQENQSLMDALRSREETSRSLEQEVAHLRAHLQQQRMPQQQQQQQQQHLQQQQQRIPQHQSYR